MVAERKEQKWLYVIGNKRRDVGEITENRGAWPRQELKRKWDCKVATGHHARSWRISGVTGWFVTYTLEGKIRKASRRRERELRLERTQAGTNESLPSKDCSSLIVKCSGDDHRRNSSNKSRSRESGTRRVKSSLLTWIPKQTFLVADGESFSGEEAKPNEPKRDCKAANAVLANAGISAP